MEQLDIEANKKRKLEEIAARHQQEERIQSPTSSSSSQPTTPLGTISESSSLSKDTQNNKPEEAMDVEMSSCGTSSNESMEVVQSGASGGARPKTARQSTTGHEEGVRGFSHFTEQFLEQSRRPEERPRQQRVSEKNQLLHCLKDVNHQFYPTESYSLIGDHV